MGVDPAAGPDAAAYRTKFDGKHAHRIVSGGMGDNLPQEAPRGFTDSVIEVDGY